MMMCARSVSRLIGAVHSLGIGITCDHSENGKVVVTDLPTSETLKDWNMTR